MVTLVPRRVPANSQIGNPVDQRIESFLADVLALAGESPDAIREGVRVALADCEAIFRAQEVNKLLTRQMT